MKKIRIFIALLIVFCTHQAVAFDTVVVPNDNPMFKYFFYNQGEKAVWAEKSYFDGISIRTFTPEERNSLIQAGMIWNDIINHSEQTRPVEIHIFANDDQNVNVESDFVEYFDEEGVLSNYKTMVLNSIINGKSYIPTEQMADIYNRFGIIDDGIILVGSGLNLSIGKGFDTNNAKTALFHGNFANLRVIIEHEIGHALGIASNNYFLEDFADFSEIPVVVTYPYVSKPTFIDGTYQVDFENSEKMSTVMQYMRTYNGSMSEDFDSSKIFAPKNGMIILYSKTSIHDLASDPRYTQNEGNVFDMSDSSPYFVGPETLKVLANVSDAELTGKTTQEIIDYCQKKIFEKGGLKNYSVYSMNVQSEENRSVLGLPMNPTDGLWFGSPTDLNHIELRNSYMSHQMFRNWTTFMEAELAFLKDIGYDINLKDYYGKSIYLDNVTTSFDEDYSSSKDFAIGLHIYGSNDTISQTANINLSGEGTFGVKIDGIQDNYNLETGKVVELTGNNTIAVGAIYGKEHQITIANDAVIKVSGKNSIALGFDFGDDILGSSLSASEEHFSMGSYLFGISVDQDDEVKGALVEQLTINGSIEATGKATTAIYSSGNAWVKNININNGANIQGDIISDWNSISYGTRMIEKQTDDILYTNLNFNNYDKDFNHNVIGSNIYNTLKVNITGNMGFNHSNISVYSINNEGNINIKGNTHIETQNSQESITGSGVLNVLDNGELSFGPHVQNIQNELVLNKSVLNLKNNAIQTMIIEKLTLNENAFFNLDTQLSTGTVDTLSVNAFVNNNQSVLTINPNIPTKTKEILVNPNIQIAPIQTHTDNILQSIKMILPEQIESPIFIYKTSYDPNTGLISISRQGNDYNKYVYAPSTMAKTMATMTGQISVLAMDKLDVAPQNEVKGLSGGEMFNTSNVWVKMMAFDDNVEFNHFNTIDSKTKTLATGVNTNTINFGYFDTVFGGYLGYIGGKQKYTDNKIEQDGGYLGLSSKITKENAFLLSTINTGFVKNEAKNSYGTDKFDTHWLGLGLKGGYNYTFKKNWVLQPNVYAGYTLVHTENYKAKSGVRVKTENLNLFEIDPGVKLSTQLDNDCQGYIQGKYALFKDKNGNTKLNKYILPNVSTKNFVEYGLGINKSITNKWSVNMEINRRDGGRTGWNGSLEVKYNF
ncbi:MAG: autotransporter outer membrane beta-barrel domain-containing protein [Alphaproteobacteria bacterium]|nr:autotransporter outer membrane beta-barrel domain-containing protein [Alphaproteobacteria bacterium]